MLKKKKQDGMPKVPVSKAPPACRQSNMADRNVHPSFPLALTKIFGFGDTLETAMDNGKTPRKGNHMIDIIPDAYGLRYMIRSHRYLV